MMKRWRGIATRYAKTSSSFLAAIQTRCLVIWLSVLASLVSTLSSAANKNLAWISSNAAVASVNAMGMVTGVKAGNAVITVKTADGARTDSCTVSMGSPVTGVTLNKATAPLHVGKTLTLTATVAPANAANKSVAWTSSNPNLAVVSNGGVVTGAKSGTCTITVTAGGGKFSASCIVTVTNEDFINEVVRLVNVERSKEGLPFLSGQNAQLNAVAAVRAEELLALYSHTRPNGQDCFSVLYEMGVSFTHAGENVAAGFTTPAAVVNGWMNSPGHRANILNPNYNCLGVGYAYKVADSNQYYHYWAQMFLRTASVPVTGKTSQTFSLPPPLAVK